MSTVDITRIVDDRKLINDKMKTSITKMKNVLSSHKRVMDKDRDTRIKEINKYLKTVEGEVYKLDELIGNENPPSTYEKDYSWNGFTLLDQRPDKPEPIQIKDKTKKLEKRYLNQKVVRKRDGIHFIDK